MTSPQPSLPLGSTPSRRPSLAFSAEPALALRSVDSGPIVELPSGDMVDAGAVSADVALDSAAPAGSLLRRGPCAREPRAAAPVPGRYEVTAPHSPTSCPGIRLVRDVGSRVLPVGTQISGHGSGNIAEP